MNLSEVPVRGQQRCFTAPEPILDVYARATASHPLYQLDATACWVPLLALTRSPLTLEGTETVSAHIGISTWVLT